MREEEEEETGFTHIVVPSLTTKDTIQSQEYLHGPHNKQKNTHHQEERTVTEFDGPVAARTWRTLPITCHMSHHLPITCQMSHHLPSHVTCHIIN
jgi:hypothetical protein